MRHRTDERRVESQRIAEASTIEGMHHALDVATNEQIWLDVFITIGGVEKASQELEGGTFATDTWSHHDCSVKIIHAARVFGVLFA